MSHLPGGLDLPDLQIVPEAALQLHERVDEQRARPLADRMREEGLLRNPPVVIPAGDRSERFVVLDGTNRTLALRLMGMRHVLVQVVYAGGTAVTVKTWNHVIPGITPSDLLEALEGFPDVDLVPSDQGGAAFNLSAGGTLAYAILAEGSVLEIVGETQTLDWGMRNLNRLVESYQGIARVERVSSSSARGPDVVYLDFAALIAFPHFEVEEVVKAASMGLLLPAGLTRFLVSPRALRVNYPLERLAADIPLETKRQELGNWLRDRLAGRHIRFYAESTFLFDE